MKTILFINQSLSIGGAEMFNKGLFVWLQKHNYSISAYVTNETFLKDLNSNGIRVKHIPIIVDIIGNWKGLVKALFLFLPAAIYYATIVIKNRKTDSILMSGFIEKILVTPIAKIIKIPVIWIEFSPLTAVFGKFLGLPRFLYTLVQNLPDRIISPSQYTKTYLHKAVGIETNKIVVIPCARDVEEYKVSTQKGLVACVSRLEKGKGQDLLLKAWKKVQGQVPYATLSIVGEGDFKSELTTLCKTLNLRHVTFKGYLKDALEEMAKSEVLVFPTLWPLEGFGLVAIEAMALGKPVVCFNFGPLPEIVDETSGILIEKGNTDKLANAIVNLLKSPELRNKLGKNGRKKYLKEFTFNTVGVKYAHLLALIN